MDIMSNYYYFKMIASKTSIIQSFILIHMWHENTLATFKKFSISGNDIKQLI